MTGPDINTKIQIIAAVRKFQEEKLLGLVEGANKKKTWKRIVKSGKA